MDAKWGFIGIFGIGIGLVVLHEKMGDSTFMGGDELQHDIKMKLKEDATLDASGKAGLAGQNTGLGQPYTAPSATAPAPVAQQPMTDTSKTPVSGTVTPYTPPAAPPSTAPVASPTPPGLTLESGQRIFFYGQRVYLIDPSTGQLAPLADGNYLLKNGQPLIVAQGKRQRLQ